MKFAIINRRVIPENFKNALKKAFKADLLSREKVRENKSLLKEYDFVFIYGIICRHDRDLCEEAGVNWIFFDKAVDRRRTKQNPKRMARFSINSYLPLKHYEKFEDDSSRIRTITDFMPIRETEFLETDSSVMFAGSSSKYHAWHDLVDPTKYAQEKIKNIRNVCNREIIYKPKPSWKHKVPVEGTIFKEGGILSVMVDKKDIKRPCCLISHGSGILMEANFLGIPTIVLGESPVKKISRTRIEDIDNPYIPTLEEKYKIANAVSFFQWNAREIESGEMWNYLKPVFEEELNGS
ncbi:hypothetical protein CL634_08920 [bacterium]|nr:hypothetical protein [bacterium]|tara:strand:+ start:332 stop:1213 length:882 start_codon:yes stop_codon:yes gene_type:complete